MAASKSSAGRSRKGSRSTGSSTSRTPAGNGLASLAEQLANRILKPLGLVILSRERIQETLDEAAERGRLTRSDANELVAELVRKGRQQTEELLSDLERRLGQGRNRLDSATRRARAAKPVDRIVRGADKARRTVAVGSSLPITGYDDMTAGQVQQRLDGLAPVELRKIADYERRHANRKSVLSAIEKAQR